MSRSDVTDVDQFELTNASRRLHLGYVTGKLADEGPRNGRADRNLAVLDVGFVVTDDLIGHCIAGIQIFELDGCAGATIANPGQIQVEVKGASDPAKWYSNRLTLNITPPPIPDYKYLGYILKNGVSTAVIRESSESELRNVRIGTKLGSYWQITKIDDKAIEIIDLRINVRHSLPLSGEGG